MKYWWVILIVITSCKKPEDRTCFKSAGEQSSISYDLNDFIYLDCFGNYNLNLYQDSLNRMVVKGGSKLISQIQYEERNDSLYITNKNKCRFLRSYDQEITIDLYYKNLDYFKFDGGDTVVFQTPLKTSYFKLRMRDGGGTIYGDLDCDYVDINLESGSGDIHLKGKSYFARLFINSTGFMFAEEFISDEMSALNYGTGDLFCNPNDGSFEATINHTGDIYYQGNPFPLKLNKKGSGELIKINP